MPTQTFFRLPEEKRERLTDAAWREFLAVSYAEASINRIVREAQIPRGSFYQYFEDKEDLFFYLLSLGREESMGILTRRREIPAPRHCGFLTRCFPAGFDRQ